MSYCLLGLRRPILSQPLDEPLDTTTFRRCAIEFSDAISGRIIVRYLREERRTMMRPRLGSNLLRASGEYPIDTLAGWQVPHTSRTFAMGGFSLRLECVGMTIGLRCSEC